MMSISLQAHRIEATLTQDGTLTLDDLPFRAGEGVEVILLSQTAPSSSNRYPLRGTPISYQKPLEPVAERDWDAAP